MAVEFPDLCEGLIPDLLEENLRKVFVSIFGDEAFKNPLESKLGGINDKLSQITGILPGTDIPDLKEVIRNFKDSIDQFKDHTDRLAGIQDTGENFVRRLSVANLENIVKQQLGQIGDSFERMFGSFGRDIDRLLNDSVTQLDLLIGVLGQGGTLREVNNIIIQLTAFSSQLTNAIANDIAALLSAENLLARFNLANLITTNNCFFETLIKDGIGTDKLLENFQQAVDFRAVVDLDVDLRPSQTYEYLKKTFEVTSSDQAKIDKNILTSDIIPQDIQSTGAGEQVLVEQSKKKPITQTPKQSPVVTPTTSIKTDLNTLWIDKYKTLFDYLDSWARSTTIPKADKEKFLVTEGTTIPNKNIVNLNKFILRQQKIAEQIVKSYSGVTLIPDAGYWETQRNIAAARWLFLSSVSRPILQNIATTNINNPLLIPSFITHSLKESIRVRKNTLPLRSLEIEMRDIPTLDSLWRGFDQVFTFGQLSSRINASRLLKTNPSAFGVPLNDINMFLFMEMTFYPPNKNEAESTQQQKTDYYKTLNEKPTTSEKTPTYIEELDKFRE
jgi:hypothetical protein